MFLATKSRGVRRLSLISGLAAACYSVANFRPNFYPGPDDPNRFWLRVENLTNLAAYAAIYFILAWSAIRVLAWIVDGFRMDRKI
jgi:hypothetical protein